MSHPAWGCQGVIMLMLPSVADPSLVLGFIPFTPKTVDSVKGNTSVRLFCWKSPAPLGCSGFMCRGSAKILVSLKAHSGNVSMAQNHSAVQRWILVTVTGLCQRRCSELPSCLFCGLDSTWVVLHGSWRRFYPHIHELQIFIWNHSRQLRICSLLIPGWCFKLW